MIPAFSKIRIKESIEGFKIKAIRDIRAYILDLRPRPIWGMMV